MGCEFEHVFRHLLVADTVKIVPFLADLVRIAKCDAQQALTAGLQCDDVLTGGEDNFGKRHHALGTYRFPDDGKCLLADFTVRDDVIRVAEVKLINLFAQNEAVNLDGALAFERDGLKLLGLHLDVFALGDFIALDDIADLDLVAAFGVDLAIFDAMARVLVELMEADLLAFRAGGEEPAMNPLRSDRRPAVAPKLSSTRTGE
jgi:hypothetical protein